MDGDGVRRPPVDVVVPFAGTAEELDQLLGRLSALRLGGGDALIVVDNRPDGEAPAGRAGIELIAARERQSSYYARNRGAARGGADWIAFIDADVEPPDDLIDRYFSEPIGERVAVLAGGVLDEPIGSNGRDPAAARYAALRSTMTQANTVLRGDWPYAQTANCAVRRAAFDEVGGFRDDLRSGGDADLCFRLQRAGWELEGRPDALVVHRSRRRLLRLLRQRARHGSGAAWLDREYPGSFPRRRWLGLAKWTVESFARAPYDAARGRSDAALLDVVDPLELWALELGRLFPNTTRR